MDEIEAKEIEGKEEVKEIKEKKKDLPTTEILKRIDYTPDLMVIFIKKPDGFNFKPGQYCTIGRDGIERPYSIVSSPLEKDIELFIELVPPELATEKSLTPRLWKLKEGDRVTIRPQAKGAFTLDENSENHVMVATVTGIAPFMSMIRSYFMGYYGDKKFKFFVFFGASYKDELIYLPELKKLADEGKIYFVPTVSRPQEERNKGWEGEKGRVNNIIEKYLDMLKLPVENTTIYLCGNQGMIDDLGNKRPGKPEGKLVKRGYKIKTEVYF